MSNQEQRIPCPVCNTTILFEVKKLLMGLQFSCPNCHATVGLAAESRPLVAETMQKIEQLRQVSSK